jgi:spermidine synthase
VVGLGPGVLPQRLAMRGITCDAVDIDPAVVSMARRHFGLSPVQQVHLQDARYFIATAQAEYDFIVLDVFAGDTTPGHLLTREALTLVRERLAPGGVLAINLIGSLGAERRVTASVMRTLASVFPWVQVYPLFVPAAGEDFGNIALLAGTGQPLRKLPPLDMAGVHPMAQELLLRALAQQYVWQERGEGLLLTDDFNPIDVLDLQLKEAVRKRILETTPAEILLSGNGSVLGSTNS